MCRRCRRPFHINESVDWNSSRRARVYLFGPVLGGEGCLLMLGEVCAGMSRQLLRVKGWKDVHYQCSFMPHP